VYGDCLLAAGGDLDRQKRAFLDRGGDTDDLRGGLNSRLMRTTAANLEDGANVVWVHVLVTPEP